MKLLTCEHVSLCVLGIVNRKKSVHGCQSWNPYHILSGYIGLITVTIFVIEMWYV